MGGQSFFDRAYLGEPPWDIGRPQSFVVALEQAGEIRGSVLDVGCGTGENVLYLAARGHETWGVDSAGQAIAKARRKAVERGLGATFVVADVLELVALGRRFDTVIDSGLFHTFDDDERPAFVESLGSVLNPGGTYYMLAFSEREAGTWGPRRVTQPEIWRAFAHGWDVRSIEPGCFDGIGEGDGALAWLATVVRESGPPHR